MRQHPVQLVADPSGKGIAGLEKITGQADKIIKIQRPVCRQGVLIGLDEGRRDLNGLGTGFAHMRRADLLPYGIDAGLLGFQHWFDGRGDLVDRDRSQLGDRCPGAILDKQGRQIGLESRLRVRRGQGGSDVSGPLNIGLAAMMKQGIRRSVEPFMGRVLPGLRLQLRRADTRVQVEHVIEMRHQPGCAVCRPERIDKIMPVEPGPVDDLAEGIRSARRQHPVNAIGGQGPEDSPPGSLDKAVRIGIVQRAEARRGPGFQREAPQKAFTEGMDGLDFQPAWCFQRLGEQAAGLVQLGRRVRAARLLNELLLQRLCRHYGPTAQPGKQALLHLCGRSLGVGDAQDFLRLHARQQQVHHPVDQNPGLAGPGIGLDEHARLWPGGQLLGKRRGGGNVFVKAGRAHSPPSEPSGALAHSPRRARWSKSP